MIVEVDSKALKDLLKIQKQEVKNSISLGFVYAT